MVSEHQLTPRESIGTDMAATIRLTIVENLSERDSVMAYPKLPAFKGSDDEHLVCGYCQCVIGLNTATRTIYQRFTTSGRLIIQCKCGTYNVLPSKRIDSL
jgi:hypothetical protein